MKDIFDLLKSEVEYFKKLKTAIGDLHGHIHSLAVKAAKIYLLGKYQNIAKWEISEKYGGGIDIVGYDEGQQIIIAAEVKTTARAEKEQLGSQQRKSIGKDLDKLIESGAQNKYLFIIDEKNQKAIESILKDNKYDNIKLINLFCQ